jgi:hypothetical protein
MALRLGKPLCINVLLLGLVITAVLVPVLLLVLYLLKA